MHATVDEVVDFVRAHADREIAHRGGTIDLARSEPQRLRLHHHLDEYRRFGFGDADYRWLEAGEARDVCATTDVAGGVRTPHSAAVHPLRLTHAVARAVQSAGGVIRERTAVERIEPRRVITERGPSCAADCMARRGRAGSVRQSFRRAALTARAVGNASATSSSSKSTFVPCANRFAYLPRTPPLKSYSARMVSTSRTRLGFFFFMDTPLAAAGWASAYESNARLATLCMNDDEDAFPSGAPNQ